MRKVQFIGTLALLFGLLRAHPGHKDKLLLVWLATAIYCALSMAYAGLMLWLSEGIFTAIFFPWSLTGECSTYPPGLLSQLAKSYLLKRLSPGL